LQHITAMGRITRSTERISSCCIIISLIGDQNISSRASTTAICNANQGHLMPHGRKPLTWLKQS